MSIEAAAGAGLLGLILAGAALGQAQSQSKSNPPAPEKGPPAPTKSKLEEALAQALRSNPDVRVAAAKVNEAEAELNRVRLQIVQKVVQAYQAVEAARADVEFRQGDFERFQEAAKRAAVPVSDVAEKAKLLATAKAQLAAAEADMAYLIGKSLGMAGKTTGPTEDLGVDLLGQLTLPPSGERILLWDVVKARPVVTFHAPTPAASASGPMADKIRKALDRPITLEVNGAPASALLQAIREAAPELHIQVPPEIELRQKVTVLLEKVSLGAALQLLEDVLPGHRIVVRDYGLLLAREDRIPSGALTLQEFQTGAGKTGPHSSEKNLPAASVRGEVVAVEENNQPVTMKIAITPGHTLAKGQVLHVYRPEKGLQPAVYLGQVRVVEVTPTNAICERRSGQQAGPIQPGDRVIDRLREN
jgi:hypothetical protein